MNIDHQTLLERRVDAELKALQPLSAPRAIASSVMAAIADRVAVESRAIIPTAPIWSIRVRFALFLVLAAIAAGICYGLLQAGRSDPVSSLAQWSNSLAQILGLIAGLVQTLVAACGIALRKLGAPVITALITAAVLCYLTCVALGTVWYRLAVGHSTNSH